MYKFLMMLAVLLYFVNPTNAQKTYTSIEDVFNIQKIYFYGYDYTNFKLADVKRMDEDVKKFMYLWIEHNREHVSEKKLPKWINKEFVPFNFTPTMEHNDKLTTPDLVCADKITIPKDSIQSIVSKYQLPEKAGIGFVVIMECFDNAGKRTSAYYTFFDIATKKVLYNQYISARDGNNYNRVFDWGIGSVVAFKQFIGQYRAKNKELNR